MLLRPDGDAVIAIGQPAHAWLSGQLARAWGNAAFGAVEPWEEVCLAAEQHDVGMAGWEQRPTLNPETGLPHSFMELDRETHLAMWSSAAPTVLAQSRYAALLVSMHGTALFDRRRGAEAFLAQQRALQGELMASLGADPAQVRRNQRLVQTWDSLSLALLLGWQPYVLAAVPAAGGELDVALDGLALDPWPFAAPAVTVRCEGRRLSGRYGDEEAMRAALAAAPWVTLTLDLKCT